mmetsp:Transcript_16588/g.54415  ORF Transcript_16588/g.54415 Transcript_16588/m.54415 type:complete len:218 (-) Transcript_16588:53-706(-)
MRGEASRHRSSTAASAAGERPSLLARPYASMAPRAARRTAGRSSAQRDCSSDATEASDASILAAETSEAEGEASPPGVAAAGVPALPIEERPPSESRRGGGGGIASSGEGRAGVAPPGDAAARAGGSCTRARRRAPAAVCRAAISEERQPTAFARTPGALSDARSSSSLHRVCGASSAARAASQPSAPSSRIAAAISTATVRAPTFATCASRQTNRE